MMQTPSMQENDSLPWFRDLTNRDDDCTMDSDGTGEGLMPTGLEAISPDFSPRYKDSGSVSDGLVEVDIPVDWDAAFSSGYRTHNFQAYTQRQPLKYLDPECQLQQGALNLVFAKPNTGKSLWAVHKLGQVAEKYPVLLILGEGSAGMPDRLLAEQIAHRRRFADHLRIGEAPLNLGNPTDVDHFITSIKSATVIPALIVIDTLSACLPGADENSAQDMTRALKSCQTLIQQLKTTLLLVHHTTKDGDDYRGHSSLHAAADVMLKLDQKNGIVTVKSYKVKDGPSLKPTSYRIQVFPTRDDPETGETVTGPALMPLNDAPTVPNKPAMKLNALTVLQALNVPHSDGIANSQLRTVTGLGSSSLIIALKALLRADYARQPRTKGPYFITEAGKNYLQNRL